MANNNIYVCDDCKKEVLEKNIVKKALGKNFHIFTPGAKVWSPDGSNEQWGLFCPHCGYLHTFGFDRKI